MFFPTIQNECSRYLSVSETTASEKNIAEQLYKKNAVFGTVISIHAIVSPYAKIGEGSVVMQGSILQSCCQTGKHCIVNTGAVIDHECILKTMYMFTHATLWQCGKWGRLMDRCRSSDQPRS